MFLDDGLWLCICWRSKMGGTKLAWLWHDLDTPMHWAAGAVLEVGIEVEEYTVKLADDEQSRPNFCLGNHAQPPGS